jgi:hypothetical protein
MLALAPPRIAIASFNLRRLTPVLPIAIGRPNPSPHRPLPKEAVNARRLQTAAAEIPIAPDAPPRPTSRGFLPWRFADAGPRVRRATFMGPASENLHRNGPERVAGRCLLLRVERTCRAGGDTAARWRTGDAGEVRFRSGVFAPPLRPPDLVRSTRGLHDGPLIGGTESPTEACQRGLDEPRFEGHPCGLAVGIEFLGDSQRLNRRCGASGVQNCPDDDDGRGMVRA